MSTLSAALGDYLDVRRALGYKLETAGRILTGFVAHLDAIGVEIVTVAAALEWSCQRPTGAASRLGAIRVFARYLQALDPAHEVPPAGLVAHRKQRPVPHLYSDAETTTLMAAARRLTPALRAATTETIIGMLAVTGMRIGEVLALDIGDVDWDAGVITVRHAKFDKARHVPVTPSTLAALDDYRRTRLRLAGTTGPALFVQPNGHRVNHESFRCAFLHLLDITGVGSSGRRPHIHHFRHSFAVTTLLDWYRTGADVWAMLPRLSTYLGHGNPADTYWYLSAAPELMALAAQRLEHTGRGWGR